jgi:Endonuclease-reverse transcriptase
MCSIQLPSYGSLENIGMHAQCCGLNLLVIVIYRPGSENVTNLFLDDFAELLESFAAYTSPLLIVVDLNVHLDEESNSSTIKFQHSLAAHGLVQHVQPATRVEGHTLDVVVTRGETPVNLMQVHPPTLSDHSLIIGQLDATSLTSVDPVLSVRSRHCRSFDIDTFSLDLSHRVSLLMKSPPSKGEVDEWFAVYDHLMRTLFD